MKLYRVTNAINSFYVLAEHPTEAQENLKRNWTRQTTDLLRTGLQQKLSFLHAQLKMCSTISRSSVEGIY